MRYGQKSSAKQRATEFLSIAANEMYTFEVSGSRRDANRELSALRVQISRKKKERAGENFMVKTINIRPTSDDKFVVTVQKYINTKAAEFEKLMDLALGADHFENKLPLQSY